MQNASEKGVRPIASRQTGFTLIELMIVVVIVGIITAVAVPSYRNYVVRGYRAEGRNALVDIAAREERYYSDNVAFTGNLYDLGWPHFSESGQAESETGRYEVSVVLNNGNQGFTATATPNRPFTDDDCGTLELTHQGVRSNTGSASLDICWGR